MLKKRIYTFFIGIILSVSHLFATDLNNNEEIPIVAWCSIPSREISVERYREIREAGFNVSFSFMVSIDDVKKALICAEEADVKLIVKCQDINSNPTKAARELKDYKALLGYFVQDEPTPDKYNEVAAIVRKIEKEDSNHFCYVNLLPRHVPKTANVQRYLNRYLYGYIKVVNPKVLSFDNYPIHQDFITGRISVDEEWYINLDEIAAAAKKYDIPFWAFGLSVAHKTKDWSYPTPTIAHLRLQMYVNLAYGARGLQYFTYWTPDQNSHEFQNALITRDGKRTQLYEIARLLNGDIQNCSFIFSKKRDSKVHQISSKDRNSVVADICVSESDCDLLASEISIDKHRRYVMIVNKDLTSSADIKISLKHNNIRVIRKDGTKADASLFENRFIIEPGDCLIFEM